MKKLLYITAMSLTLSACGDNEQQVQQQPIYQQQAQQQEQIATQPQQPIIVQSAPAQSSGMQDMLIGGLIGHAMAGGSGSQQRTIVNRTVINRTYVAPRRSFSSRTSRSSRRK